MKALASIHDCMPETLARVEELLDWLAKRDVPPVTLLIVPGKEWQPAQLERLRELAALGHPLAGHGWHHQTRPRRLKHRMHAALISRNVAEHLDLNAAEIQCLLQRAHEWFPKNSLPAPDLYVPPAWALGPISSLQLQDSPYTCIETTRGLIFPQAGNARRFQALPLTGYEADTVFRAKFLKYWNAAQARIANRTGKPLRISIHPNDLYLRRVDQLEHQVRAVTHFLNYPKQAL
jgi:predicted deacetylase